MADVTFTPFGKQKEFLRSTKRIKGAFAGKRGGKTEVGAIESIKLQEEKRNGEFFGIDPFLGVIIAPTGDMLRRLSLKKFLAYAKPFIRTYQKSVKEITWHDGSIIYGLSAEKPERIEGIKAAWIWIDEVFQVSEELFLECLARVADTNGYIICTGSLGVQFVNPKAHWAYKYFKEQMDADTVCFEWSTVDNPHFPKEQIENLKSKLDPTTFRAMFELTWDTVPKTAVYHDFSDINVTRCTYQEKLDTYVSIDWGFAHPMAVGIFQHNPVTDSVYQIEEIVESRLTLEELAKRLLAKPYKYKAWICDIAGNQEREQTGISNVAWFRKHHQIAFKHRATAINYGIPIVRSYIKNGKDQARFFIDPSCKKTIDGIKQYKYAEKNGSIVNENPVKKDDDAVDMVRYFFVNILDPAVRDRKGASMISRG